MISKDFEDQKVVVTGGSSGIGRSVCIALSRAGANVVIVGRDENRLQETLDLMDGSHHCMFSFDLCEIEHIENLVRDIYEWDGRRIDAFAHSAGVVALRPLLSINHRFMDEIMRINLYSFLELCRHILKKKYSESCKIVAVSSVASTMPSKGQVMYAASKAALDVAIKTIAQEYARKGVRINTVNPGVVDTRMTQFANEMAQLATEEIAELAARQVLGTGRPEHVADAVLFLLSEKAEFITGSNMVVDGGRF